MSQFSVEEFFSDPASHLNSILYAKKGELLELAIKFGVVPPPNAKKDVLRKLVVLLMLPSQ